MHINASTYSSPKSAKTFSVFNHFFKMSKTHFISLLLITAVCLLLVLPHFHGGLAIAAGTQDGSEKWGYVQVRPSKIQPSFSIILYYVYENLPFYIFKIGFFFGFLSLKFLFEKTGAHMFWWYYKSPYRTHHPNKPWPIVLWLQGGPVSACILI